MKSDDVPGRRSWPDVPTSRAIALLFLATLVVLPHSGAAALQPAPGATPAVSAVRETRPTCAARPRAASELVAILRQPIVEDPAVHELQGEPLPPGERGAIGNLVAAWSACLASGNVPGLLGLFTADGLRRLLDDRAPFIAGPAGLRVSILAVTDVVRLTDGRIGASVVLDPSGAGTAPPISLTMIIERADGGDWRIDHLRESAQAATAMGSGGSQLQGPPRVLLRRPIAPGSGVPLQPPGAVVPMRGMDMSRTGIAPGPAPTSSPEERWRTPTGWHSDAQPIVARGLVYFGGFSLGERTPQLVAVEEGSGRVRWQTTAPVAWAEFPDAPALASDTLFAPVQAPVAGIMAVAASTGDPLWFAPFGFTSLTAPAVDAEAIFVSGWSVRNPRDRTANDAIGTVIALDQRTGREIWRYLAPARFDTVAVGATLVYVPSDRGLFALDRLTGAKRWQARFSPGAGESVVVAGDRIVFAGWEITSAERGVFALDAASGALTWRHELAASSTVRAGTAAVAGTMFVTSWESDPDGSGVGAPTLQAFEIASGAERWAYRVAGSGASRADVGSGWVTPPVIIADSVMFGVAVRDPILGAENADGLYAVEAVSGQLLWHAATDPIRSAPSVVDQIIYAMGGLRARGGATGGNLYAFSAD